MHEGQGAQNGLILIYTLVQSAGCIVATPASVLTAVLNAPAFDSLIMTGKERMSNARAAMGARRRDTQNMLPLSLALKSPMYFCN